MYVYDFVVENTKEVYSCRFEKQIVLQIFFSPYFCLTERFKQNSLNVLTNPYMYAHFDSYDPVPKQHFLIAIMYICMHMFVFPRIFAEIP